MSERLTVLVVDDYDDTRWVMRCWLERGGYRVVEAADGAEAVEVAGAESPDLILMDIEMPVLDGLEATRRIRRLPALGAVPIIAVSAYGERQFRRAALEAGCNEYVPTPVSPPELGEMLSRMLSSREGKVA